MGLGAAPANDLVHRYDGHATIVRMIGYDHPQLNFRYYEHDFRPANKYGQSVEGLIA